MKRDTAATARRETRSLRAHAVVERASEPSEPEVAPPPLPRGDAPLLEAAWDAGVPRAASATLAAAKPDVSGLVERSVSHTVAPPRVAGGEVGEGSLPAEGQDEAAPRRRRVEVAAFQAWQLPGLCNDQENASEAHRSLMRRFRAVDADDGARIYLDPRLPDGAQLPLLAHLEEGRRQAQSALGLTTGSPEVFAYHDIELLLAAACTNDDVVAYYDGALHVVVTRADVRESVIHEYTHHALMTHGIIGPTWAQEGIAMHVAGETWWRAERWLARALDQPFSLESMERAIPYTLSSEQAVAFYVQAAAMVECAARRQADGLAGLVTALRGSHSKAEVSYDLAVPGEPAELRACIQSLLGGTGAQRQP